jgi:hypothetical protein
MNPINASDCGSTGALVMSAFHQLSAGNSVRPDKSSLSVTAVDAGGPGEGVGAGAGVDTGGGVEVDGLVGVAGVLFEELHAATNNASAIANFRTRCTRRT